MAYMYNYARHFRQLINEEGDMTREPAQAVKEPSMGR
jgi:hypothetical protein